MTAGQDNLIRFSFNFDLDIAKSKEVYPSDNPNGYKKAWTDILSFMEANEFTHAQYSGYESINEILYADAYATLEKLQAEFPWFLQCAQVATLTEIGERYDVLEHLKQQDNDKEQVPQPTMEHSNSLKDYIVRNAKLACQELNDSNSIESLPNHDR